MSLQKFRTDHPDRSSFCTGSHQRHRFFLSGEMVAKASMTAFDMLVLTRRLQTIDIASAPSNVDQACIAGLQMDEILRVGCGSRTVDRSVSSRQD